MHTEQTLDIFEALTRELGQKLREFRDKMCAEFDTRELEREANARYRCEAKKSSVPVSRLTNQTSANDSMVISSLKSLLQQLMHSRQKVDAVQKILILIRPSFTTWDTIRPRYGELAQLMDTQPSR